VYKGKFEKFIMREEDESISDMFNWLNEIVNELKGLGLDVPVVDFSHKFFRSPPKKYHFFQNVGTWRLALEQYTKE
jgi:hypothetical protein